MRLVDTETINGTFTWNNKRGGAHQVASKLDRFMISKDLFPSGLAMTTSILPFGGSHHWSVQLEATFMGTPRNRHFRFENAWLSHPNFTNNFETWWREELNIQGSKMYMLQQKLKHIKACLKVWNKNEFANIFKAKRETELKLQEMNQIIITNGFTEERQKLTNSLQEDWENRCLQEEIFWRQKSRIQWIKEGERNTKFFHKTTIDNRAHNRIIKIKDSQGIELVSHSDMESVLVQHFCNTAKEPLEDRSEFIENFTQYIPQMVTREEKHNLNRPISEEVVVEDSRRSKKVLKALNASFIALIPKQEKVVTPYGFRTISLCNVLYKIISKVIANRLKPLLPFLISEEQTGFVEGRQILNNIIQAHEVVHSLKRSKQAGMSIQLDLTKAYEKLSWAYIRTILKAYGFGQNWIRWVMELVTSTNFSKMLNGAPSRTFTPSKGHRQGDPLSPFLFVLRMEGLGREIKMENVEGRI
eukprot:PITA_25366